MLNFYSLSSYVQFLGAFNFANVYSPLQDKLFKHFLNIDKMFSESFFEMRQKIRSDIDSVGSMALIETTDGLSNSSTISELKESLSSLLEEEKELRSRTKGIIKKEFTMRYSRPMFMSFGLYCTFELLTFGLMDMLKVQSIYTSFALYNIFMLLLALYFVLCESLTIFQKHQYKIFKPTRWGMMLVSILAYGIFFANTWLVERFGCMFELPINFVEVMCCWCILIPAIPFLFAFMFTFIHYKRSKKLIKEKTGKIYGKFQEIHKKKTAMDDLYSMLSKSEVSYGGLDFGK